MNKCIDDAKKIFYMNDIQTPYDYDQPNPNPSFFRLVEMEWKKKQHNRLFDYLEVS